MKCISSKTSSIIFKIVILSFLSLSTLANAGIPVWTFTPLTPTSISVTNIDTAIVEYIVTNQSVKPHSLVLTPIAGITQNTTGAGICGNPFNLPVKGASCKLSLQVHGDQLSHSIVDGPIVCEHGSKFECYRPSQANVLNITLIPNPDAAILTTSVSNLALSVNDPGLNPALTGTPRRITITNVGTLSALNVAYTLSTPLPTGTTITPANCGTIAPAGSCVLTIIPGNTPSASPGDTSALPIILSIAGSNTNTVTPSISILTYGSVYQSGYLFAVDNTTPNTSSIGGQVAALTDQAPVFPNGILWSSDGSNGLDITTILGIDETSSTFTPSPIGPSYPVGTPAYTACTGNADGVCDTSNIVSYYNFNRATGGSAPTPLTLYAAGLCKATIGGFNDWYLPAICQMGYDTVGTMTGCGTDILPTLQNMQSNLVDNGNIGALLNFYWSSTEYSALPSDDAWSHRFQIGNSLQNPANKGTLLAVRCVRALTQ